MYEARKSYNMGVNVSKSAETTDLLIVRDDCDELTKYSYVIKEFAREALVGFTVRIVRVFDLDMVRNGVLCKKVLFLVNAKTNSLKALVPQWLTGLPLMRASKKRRYFIVNEDDSMFYNNDGIIQYIGSGDHKFKVMSIPNIGSVFRWWPRFLKFIFPNDKEVLWRQNVSFSEVFITDNGFESVNDSDPTLSKSVLTFLHRQNAFSTLLLQENFRTVQPDIRILLVNTQDFFSKKTLGKCLRRQPRNAIVFLDRDFDDALLRGFDVDIYTPSSFINGIFRHMKTLRAIDPQRCLRTPAPPIGPLELQKLRSSILGNGVRVFINLKWRGYMLQQIDENQSMSAKLLIERLWLRSQEWTVVARGLDCSQHRFEDSVSDSGDYKYRISCVNAWGTASEALQSDWIYI